MKLSRLIGTTAFLLLMVLTTACGSKRNPTGGSVDTEKPALISSYPAELETLSQGILEIDFSKAMDKGSITNAVYIYPPVLDRKITLSKATLRIEINENLKPDTFYYVTLTTRLKDLRGNALDKPYTLTFKSGIRSRPGFPAESFMKDPRMKACRSSSACLRQIRCW